MAVTVNLGQVQAIWVGTVAPTNTTMIWYDTNVGIFLQKYYDINSSTWVTFTMNGAVLPLERSGDNILILYNTAQFELLGGTHLSIRDDVLASVTPPFPISDIIGLQDALDSKVDKITGYSLLSDSEIARLLTLTNFTLPGSLPPSIIAQDSDNRFVTDAQIAAWNAKQDSLGYIPYNATNPEGYLNLADINAMHFLNDFVITLPVATSVANRVIGTIEGVDYLTEWTIESSGDNPNDLLITHNLNRDIFDVKIYSVDGASKTMLWMNQAYSGIVAPDTNTLLIKNLATIALPIVIHLVFSS